MRNTRRHFFGLLLCFLLACTQGALPDAHSEDAPAALDYVELLTGGAQNTETLPLLIVLHGLGDRPEHFVELFADLPVKARVIAARAPDPWGEGTSWYPIDDEKRKPAVIRARAAQIVKLMDQIAKTHPILGKPMISGFSQGGVLSFAMAALHSERIALALPIAGSLPSELWPKTKLAASMELIAFHGDGDRRIPFRDAERTLGAFIKAGSQASLKPYRGVGHGISPAMRAEIYAVLAATMARVSTPK